MNEEFKGSILYELICCAQWVEEKEDHIPLPKLPESSNGVIYQLYSKSFLKGRQSIHDTVSWLSALGPTAKCALTSDGKIMAVLQSSTVETRSDRDNFGTHIGRSTIPKDLYPNFRCMCWNNDGSLLAVSLTNGQVLFFDLMATQVFSVRFYSSPAGETVPFSLDLALVGMFFVEERVKRASFANELVTVDRRGTVKSFRQNTVDGMELHHEASLRRYYPQGITAVAYSKTHSVMLVCGILEGGSEITKKKEQNLTHGVTAWRLLNDHPHYKIVFNVSEQDYGMDSRSLWRMAFAAISPSSKTPSDVIFRLHISPDGKLLAAAHTSGAGSVWHLPSLKLCQFWPLKSQFQFSAENQNYNKYWRVALNRSRSEQVDPWRFHPFDISWWNNEVVIISRSNGCVSLCSIQDHVPSRNLLGDSPEYFESPVYVSSRFGKGFFAVEGELRIKGEDGKESSMLYDSTIVPTEFWAKTIYQEVLFWMTDSERFRPPRKRKKKPPTWLETHRIFNVRSITPLELFHRKIDAEEYGEALDLAKIYKLDSDLVFQRRWTRSRVTTRTIKDYLAKITKRNWVLQECLERVPDNAEAARQLLEFGLKGTDITAAVTISQGKDKGRFIMWVPDDLDISQDEYLTLLDKDNLEVQRLISYRRQFLHFLDMLNTYETILGGPVLALENFDSSVYSKLRKNTPLQSCVEMARSSDTSGLKIMLTNHWADVSSYYLFILSSFPETTPPHTYRDFLPEIDHNGRVLLWDEIASKEKDWSDRFPVAVSSDETFTPPPESHTSEYICHWYECRVREIESLTGLTNLALDLARLAVQRNITKLENLVENLETVEALVYDLGIEDTTLDKLEKLPDLEKLELLMSKATDETFVNHFRLYALPFLEHCERREPGSKLNLMNHYLTSISQNDLKRTVKIFEASKRESVDPIISDVCDVMKLAHNCIYACKSSKQNENILSLLGCLPDRGYSDSKASREELDKLHDAIDELELHYHAVQILEKYSLPYSLKEIRFMADDLDEVGQFFDKLCQGANKKSPPMKVNEWKTLLYDILELQKRIFTKYDVEKCYMTYVAALLRSGNAEVINLARNFLDQTPTEVDTDERGNLKITRRNSTAYSTSFALYLYLIPYEESLGMVLDTAELYFDSASNYSDSDMELAKVCLNLMQNSKEPSIVLMFDLIDAVKVLNRDFNLHILPQSVRRSHDKVGLLRKAMENITGGYKKTQQLLKLAAFLRLDEMTHEEVESCVFEMTGDAGIAESDIKFCTQICHNIMAKGYHAGWKVFTQVAKFQSDPPLVDHDTRLAFINYALNICPDDQIFEVLNAKYLIEIRSLQAQLTELSPNDSAVEAAMLETQEQETIVHDTLNKKKFEEFVHTTTTWINPLKKMAEVVITAGSDAILSRGGYSADTSTQRSDFKPSDDDDQPNENFLKESYPAFYLSDDEVGRIHQSMLASRYDTFSRSTFSSFIKANPALELCLTINRIWHLERLVLGPSEAGDRDFKVLEQLVNDILPEDIPWGLAILSSIEDIDVLSQVLNYIPHTEVSHKVIVSYLAFRVVQELNKDEVDTLASDVTRLIAEAVSLAENEELIENNRNSVSVRKLVNLFRQQKEQVSIPSLQGIPKDDIVSDEEDYQAGDGWED